MKNIIALLILGIVAFWIGQIHFRQPEHTSSNVHQTTQQTTILAQIRQLNRLESVSYHMNSVIKTHKDGNWFALWQDSQKGLFVAKGRVQAGLDLDKLSEKNIHVLNDTTIINLPPVSILSVQLDNIEVFDIKTGLFNVYQADLSVLQTVQLQAKQHILHQACQNQILQHAQQRSVEQIHQLFALTGQKVSVYASPQIGACRVN